MQGISISGQGAWSSIIVSFAIFIIIWGLIPGLTIKYVCKSQTLGIASFFVGIAYGVRAGHFLI
ncbi:putative membrane protein [Priestia megaterium]|jgi:hypothetical protein|uniref:Putative membrane protein n=1 Tax=Priestia megaterium (strain ATCC 14581 / DSM 32 / CCUG 1817 / JCM 2506 / NBRC 15308 / NCIMB 9376 / NCTC 10342 / NRRL B-14308 / VKM B-512 / Ford 19) TaxID=1348623 RepID=A0A0B6AJM3_PRIM2|nr:hypothetical protein [Priestia megaterium]AJI23731.1 putative membrane protein [Priestia megaterium NBRC 15308 = ATCC 14581]KFM96074.1 putative membrane protein [Priestia megaterium]KGJ74178.1 hypothetical protein BMT_07415 [Priestia megaterium NBRC 15308 = ATCC 14581]KLV30594.1 hypothetical protein ABW04_17925 [Priestia megaterium]MBU8755912.1 hypothetical protein [Priestia megaterium]